LLVSWSARIGKNLVGKYHCGNLQNPIEQEGTYPLPEAQLDRFMFNIWVDYPSYIEELAIVKATTSDTKVSLQKLLNAQQIMEYQELVRRIPVADNVLEYAVKLVAKTRVNAPEATQLTKDYITWGAGPRASQYLIVGAKCHAALRGKYSPDIEDVKIVAKAILRHRLVRNYRAEAEGYSMDRIIEELYFRFKGFNFNSKLSKCSMTTKKNLQTAV